MEFRLPELGEGIFEAELVAWLVKLGIDLTRVPGSGPQGRILVDDVTGFVRAPAASPAAEAKAQPAEPGPDYGRPGTRAKLQGLRRKIAERMVQSKTTIPHYSYVD